MRETNWERILKPGQVVASLWFKSSIEGREPVPVGDVQILECSYKDNFVSFMDADPRVAGEIVIKKMDAISAVHLSLNRPNPWLPEDYKVRLNKYMEEDDEA